MFGKKKKKGTRLAGLEISSVDVCDVGANQEAHMRLAKRDAGADVEDEEALTKRVGAFFMALFKKAAAEEKKPVDDPKEHDDDDDEDEDDEKKPGKSTKVDKSASSFAEAKGRQDVWRDLDTLCCAIRESFTSIIRDPELKNDAKRNLLNESVGQVADSLKAMVNRWMGEEGVKKSDDGGDADLDNPPVESGSTDEVQKGMVDDMKFDVSKMTPEERAQYEALAKKYGGAESAPAAADGIAAEELKKRDDAIAELTRQNTELAESIKKMANEQLEASLTVVAKKYEVLGKKPEELVPVLKNMKSAGDEVYNAYIAALDASVETVQKSGVFSEIGKKGSQGGGTAEERIEARAVEIMKSNSSMSMAQARVKAWEENPELVSEYEKSR